MNSGSTLYPDFYSAWIETTFGMLTPKAGEQLERQTANDCILRPTMAYGEIQFADEVGGSSTRKKSAFRNVRSSDDDEDAHESKQYIRLKSVPPSLQDAQTYGEQIKEMMCTCWDLKLPRFVISITGGATTFELPPRLDAMIKQGLQNAARSSNTWIITAGTNCGVMRYAGKALEEIKDEDAIGPVIAVAPWAVLNGKDTLNFVSNERRDAIDGEADDCEDGFQWVRGDVANYPDPDSFDQPYRSLDRNHSHFILVDDGRDGANEFGGEIETRSIIEKVLNNSTSTGVFNIEYPIATVVVAIQGGPGTVKTCLGAITSMLPVVIVNGSGKAADAIAYAYFMAYDPTTHKCTEAGLREIVRQYCRPGSQDDVIDKEVELVKQCVVQKEQITVFEVDFYGRHDVPLDVAILNAVFAWDEYLCEEGKHLWLSGTMDEKERSRRNEIRKARNLELALTWGRIDIATRETAKFRILNNFAKKMKEKDPITKSKSHMLKWALTHKKTEFVKLFLETMDNDDISNFLELSNKQYPPPPKVGRRSKKKTKGRQRNDVMADQKNWEEMSNIPEFKNYYRGVRPMHIDKLFLKKILECYYQSNLEEIGNSTELNLKDVHSSSFQISSINVSSWHLLTRFDEFFVDYILGCGLMIAKAATEDMNNIKICLLNNDKEIWHFARSLHLSWVHRMTDDGWNYGTILNESKQRSPLLKDFPSKESQLLNEDKEWVERVLQLARGFLMRLKLKYSIVVYEPTVLESLFVWSTLADSDREKAELSYLHTILPKGLPLQHHILTLLNEAVGRNAKYCDITKLSPNFLLLVWSVCVGSQSLAEYFWSLLPRSAITTSIVVTRIVAYIVNKHEEMQPETELIFTEISEYFFSLCEEVIDFLEKNNSELAEEILLVPERHGGYIEPRLLAFDTEHFQLVAKRPFSRVTTRLWYGGVDSSNNILKVLLGVFMPLYVLIPGKLRKKEKYAFSSSSSSSVRKLKTHTYIEYFHVHVPIRMVSDSNEYTPPDTSVAWSRLQSFYTSPNTKFTIQTLSFLLFLVLFSYSTILPTKEYKKMDFSKGDDVVLLITFAWMVSLMIDEWAQAFQLGLMNWWSSLWNKLDFAMIILYLLSLSFRFSSNQRHLGWARYIYSFVAVVLWLRLARNYVVNENLGPKLIMVQKMVAEIFVFVALMFLVYAGYAIALYSVLYEDRTWDAESIADIMYQPYFQIYGELFLEEMRSNTRCINDNYTGCGTDSGWIVVPMLAVYILIGNILLVNLLIAMMSRKHDDVQEYAKEIWEYQRMDILEEVRESWSSVPNPFTASFRLYQGLKYILCEKKGSKVWPYGMSKKNEMVELEAKELSGRKVLDDCEEYVENFIETITKKEEDATAKALHELNATIANLQAYFTEISYQNRH
eukprot:m.80880 g.80880  ORF g.80880 m.80880 type:complete len:1394 (+) comp8637_c1_seq1:1744-5925(+)